MLLTKNIGLGNKSSSTGCKKLKHRDGWRIRVTDYRIIYKIKNNILQIIVFDIDHRKQVYRWNLWKANLPSNYIFKRIIKPSQLWQKIYIRLRNY